MEMKIHRTNIVVRWRFIYGNRSDCCGNSSIWEAIFNKSFLNWSQHAPLSWQPSRGARSATMATQNLSSVQRYRIEVANNDDINRNLKDSKLRLNRLHYGFDICAALFCITTERNILEECWTWIENCLFASIRFDWILGAFCIELAFHIVGIFMLPCTVEMLTAEYNWCVENLNLFLSVVRIHFGIGIEIGVVVVRLMGFKRYRRVDNC